MIPLLISALISLLIFGFIAAGWRDSGPHVGEKQEKPPISLIIAAHNEAENLRKYLPEILGQAYPAFEVIVALDRCTDASAEVVKSLAQRNERLRFVEISSVPDGWAPKKNALARAIKMARYEHLAFTDADCAAGPQWLSAIGNRFSAGAEIVLGIGAYARRPGLLNLFIRYETIFTAFQYIGLAGMGMPYMAVGRNLAYTRAFYEANEGFEAIRKPLSGDDDLLVNKFAGGREIASITRPETQTVSAPETTWKGWFRQKMRHFSAAGHYSIRSKIILALFHGAHTIFYLSLFFVLCGSPDWPLVALALAARWASGMLIFFATRKTGSDPGMLIAWPMLDLLYLIYNLVVGPAGIIAKPKWRESRNVEEYK